MPSLDFKVIRYCPIEKKKCEYAGVLTCIENQMSYDDFRINYKKCPLIVDPHKGAA